MIEHLNIRIKKSVADSNMLKITNLKAYLQRIKFQVSSPSMKFIPL